MAKIVNIRGTSGSGKSTVARAFLDNYPRQELKDADGKIKGYRVDLTSEGLNNPLFILGRYTTACGGLDTINTQQEAADLAVKAWSSGGHVLMEGLLTSAAGPKGAVPITLKPTGSAIYAVLDTPLDTCLERVMKRREARGDTRPFNPTNTEAKYSQVFSAATLLHNDGDKVITLDHQNAFKQVLNIYLEDEQNGR